MSVAYEKLKRDIIPLLTPEQWGEIGLDIGLRPGQLENMTVVDILTTMQNQLYLEANNVSLLREFISRLRPYPEDAINLIDNYIITQYMDTKLPDMRAQLSKSAKRIMQSKYSKIAMAPIYPPGQLTLWLASELTTRQFEKIAEIFELDPATFNNFRTIMDRTEMLDTLREKGIFEKWAITGYFADILEEIKANVAATEVRKFQREYFE